MTGSGQDPGGASWEAADEARLARGMDPREDNDEYEAAWAEFERRYVPKIKGFLDARAREWSEDHRQDLLLEAVERIHKGIAGFFPRRSGALLSWCIKITDRVLQDFWRGRLEFLGGAPSGRAELVSFDEIADRCNLGHVAEESEDYQAIAAPRGTPRAVETAETRMIREAFDALNETHRAILWLTIVQGDSDAFIASVVGKPEDRVRKIRYKAIQRLKQEFEKCMALAREAS